MSTESRQASNSGQGFGPGQDFDSDQSTALYLSPTVAGSLVGAHAGGLNVPTPFASRICLLDEEVVVGTTHVEDVGDIVAHLTAGDRLRFRRDPGNAFDANCIQVLAPDGRRMGFVAATRNHILARLMDGGKTVYGIFTEASVRGSWHRITMEVYLDD